MAAAPEHGATATRQPLDLWTFLVEVYKLPEVAPACLRLQEAFQLDVVLFLAVLYAAGRGRHVDAEAIAALEAGAVQWRDEVVRPLRLVRSRMKAHPWMARPDAPPFREAVKALELRAERIEAVALEEALADLPESDAARMNLAGTIEPAGLLVLDHAAGPGASIARRADVSRIAQAAATLLREPGGPA
ncbi:TIGR02444 family protein [Mangrovicella endophytica]|uniref:TIGR02444 family protein n=1 Tax=Mangrovicella endophytica TaxID=2066697 RepID=UPI000C9E94B0|nr:TIGR02444 family protein [Mangrovicella endophytica]